MLASSGLDHVSGRLAHVQLGKIFKRLRSYPLGNGSDQVRV